jgi:hypothetical protein
LQSSVLFVAWLDPPKRLCVRLNARGQNEGVTPIILRPRHGKPIAQSIEQFRIDRVNAQPRSQQRFNYRAVIHLDGNGYLLRIDLSLDHESNQGTQALARVRETPLLRLLLTVYPANLVRLAPPVDSDPSQGSFHLFSVSIYVVGWRILSEPVLALVI